ncbi:hypothetical protein [Xanthomarina spongicola]|uniref:Lipocalin-like protein n=1 Tax=Xanthomarina spongicola TaxID=570520 RepID=A0A316DNR4_9FLAO|nr:hypothetical protein [Xanthomarina spongicola]PWK19674.1 hypothetical protein LX78_01024 [Xanthomarina spongicola]
MKTINKILMALIVVTLISCSDDNPLTDSGQNNNNNNNEPTYNLDALQGDWIRVGGNNPNNEGMVVKVTNDKAKILDPVASGFLVDDIKWKTIEAIDEENYNHLELGSDLNYYNGTIEFGVDDTLRISVGSSGPGSVQKWIRQ